MGTANSYQEPSKRMLSSFALLVDDINKMSATEQKALRLQINNERLSPLAKAIDKSVIPHNFSEEEISAMVTEARKNGYSQKKG